MRRVCLFWLQKPWLGVWRGWEVNHILSTKFVLWKSNLHQATVGCWFSLYWHLQEYRGSSSFPRINLILQRSWTMNHMASYLVCNNCELHSLFSLKYFVYYWVPYLLLPMFVCMLVLCLSFKLTVHRQLILWFWGNLGHLKNQFDSCSCLMSVHFVLWFSLDMLPFLADGIGLLGLMIVMEASTEASTITVITAVESAIEKLYSNNSCNFVLSTVPERSSCTSELQLSTSSVLQEPRFH